MQPPQRFERLLAEERQQLAADRLEREAEQLAVYRQTVVAAAISNKTVAPQLLDFFTGGAREEIDNAAHLAALKTQEILAEVAEEREGELPVQARDEHGQFIPAQPTADPRLPQGLTAEEQTAAADGSLTLRDYAALRARLGMAGRDVGIFG